MTSWLLPNDAKTIGNNQSVDLKPMLQLLTVEAGTIAIKLTECCSFRQYHRNIPVILTFASRHSQIFTRNLCKSADLYLECAYLWIEGTEEDFSLQ